MSQHDTKECTMTMLQAAQKIERLESELAKAREVVPVTADGARISGGMRIYDIEGDSFIVEAWHDVFGYWETGACEGESDRVAAACFYSTKKAATQAMKEGE